jgi:hypothetical protein
MSKAIYHWQGSLDGLCGHYAIVNALTLCGVLTTYKSQETLFRKLFKEVPVIYDGMSFKKMRQVLRRRQNSWPSIVIRTPFAGKNISASRNLETYLDQLFSSDHVECAIIKIQRKSDGWDEHWIVFKRDGKRVQFIDSVCQDGDTYIVKNRSALRMGRRKDVSAAEWHVIDRREAIIFESKANITHSRGLNQP